MDCYSFQDIVKCPGCGAWTLRRFSLPSGKCSFKIGIGGLVDFGCGYYADFNLESKKITERLWGIVNASRKLIVTVRTIASHSYQAGGMIDEKFIISSIGIMYSLRQKADEVLVFVQIANHDPSPQEFLYATIPYAHAVIEYDPNVWAKVDESGEYVKAQDWHRMAVPHENKMGQKSL